MNNLECRKQGFNKIICKRTGKEILLVECNNCPYKEYKTYSSKWNKNGINAQWNVKTSLKKENMHNKSQKTVQKSAKIKKKSSKLAKMERERESLFTDDKNKCMFCGSTYQLTWHEIYAGKNRQMSMKYKLCLRMCLHCHGLKQEDKTFNDEWHKKGQLAFMTNYPNLDFIQIFGRNYLK